MIYRKERDYRKNMVEEMYPQFEWKLITGDEDNYFRYDYLSSEGIGMKHQIADPSLAYTLGGPCIGELFEATSRHICLEIFRDFEIDQLTSEEQQTEWWNLQIVKDYIKRHQSRITK